MAITGEIDDNEHLEVSRKGTMTKHKAINYLLTGHHVRTARHSPILLVQKDDRSYFLHRGCRMPGGIQRDTNESFNHQDDPVSDGAFVSQLELLEETYKAIYRMLRLTADIPEFYNLKHPSQERSEETLDRGEQTFCFSGNS